MASIDLYHTTTWTGLETILADGLLRPSPFTKEDLKTPTLAALASCHLNVVWLSNQRWVRSRFGAYVLTFKSEDLLTPEIVPLGEHNGARCFLAVPTALSRHVAKRISAPTLDPFATQKWQPQCPNDRIDILAAWPVPAPHRLEFTSSVKVGDSRIETTEMSAKARLTAKMLTEQNHHFDNALAPYLDTVGNLLRVLVGGYLDAFQRAVIEADPSIRASPTMLLDLGLRSLAGGDPTLAKSCVAQIGDYPRVADELAAAASKHFGQTFKAVDVMRAAEA